MDQVGVNPARIIPLLTSFVDELRPGQRARGIGEPVPNRRTVRPSLPNARSTSRLLNLAFEEAPFWLVCPYDIDALSDAVLDEAHRSHAFLASPGTQQLASASFPTVEPRAALERGNLSAPPGHASRLVADASSLASARQLVRERASELGLAEQAAGDFALAVHEVIANSLKHGGGLGEVCLWSHPDAVICEVHDKGYLADPLAGRRRPASTGESGRGLWMANQLCDLVQIRTGAEGTTVRLHMRTGW